MRRLTSIVGVVALGFTRCARPHANPAIDSGVPSNNGLLFPNDAAILVCEEAGASVFVEGGRDASMCQPTRHVSYANDVLPLLMRNCSGEVCHSGSWGSSGAYEALVGVTASQCCDGRKLVQPGDPKHSYVVEKLRGVDLCRPGKMPEGRTFAEQNIVTIEDWICEGAPVE